MSPQLFLVYSEIRSQRVISCLQEGGVLNKMLRAENVISQVKDECSYIPINMEVIMKMLRDLTSLKFPSSRGSKFLHWAKTVCFIMMDFEWWLCGIPLPSDSREKQIPMDREAYQTH